MRTLAVVTVVGVYGVCTATAPALTQLVGENRVAIGAGFAPARTGDSHPVSLTPAGHGEAVGGAAARLDDVQPALFALGRFGAKGLVEERGLTQGYTHQAGRGAVEVSRLGYAPVSPGQRGQDSPAPSTFIDLEDGAVGRALRFEEWCALNADEGAYITRWPVD